MAGSAQREMDTQVLDSMDIERERGITIKAQSVTLDYTARNGQAVSTQLSLIRPGMLISPMKCHAPSPRVKGRFWL